MQVATERVRKASYDDILALPEHRIGEILDGELVVSPRPRNRHAYVILELGARLRGGYGLDYAGPEGWLFLPEPEVHPSPDVVVPDIAGWRRERLPRDEALPDYLTIAADWVCEVLSPTTIGLDQGAKQRIYARNRVSHLWLLDPVAKTLETHEMDGAAWRRCATYRAGDTVAAPPFTAVPYALDRLWLEL